MCTWNQFSPSCQANTGKAKKAVEWIQYFLCLLLFIKLDQGWIRSNLTYGLSTPYRLTKEQCWTVTPCPYPHRRPAIGPSCTEFVYPRCWHFDNVATSCMDDVLIEYVGLPRDLPLTLGRQVE